MTSTIFLVEWGCVPPTFLLRFPFLGACASLELDPTDTYYYYVLDDINPYLTSYINRHSPTSL
jgi:hypothetical protein